MKADEATFKEALVPAFLTRLEVLSIVRISPMTLWRLEQRGEFPIPVKLSRRRVGYKLRDITAWMGGKRDWKHENNLKKSETLNG